MIFKRKRDRQRNNREGKDMQEAEEAQLRNKMEQSPKRAKKSSYLNLLQITLKLMV